MKISRFRLSKSCVVLGTMCERSWRQVEPVKALTTRKFSRTPPAINARFLHITMPILDGYIGAVSRTRGLFPVLRIRGTTRAWPNEFMPRLVR